MSHARSPRLLCSITIGMSPTKIILLYGPAFGARLSGLLGFFGPGAGFGLFCLFWCVHEDSFTFYELNHFVFKFSFLFLLDNGALPVFAPDLCHVNAVGGGYIPENLLLFLGIERDRFGFRYPVEHEPGSDVPFRLEP